MKIEDLPPDDMTNCEKFIFEAEIFSHITSSSFPPEFPYTYYMVKLCLNICRVCLPALQKKTKGRWES